jgi:SPP1 gp7 family putative phage head morphogenesis protein
MRESQTVDRVRLLADRTYTDIEGVNQRLANDLRKSLIDGLMNRQSPSTIARAMSEDLGIARKAAERIARTELVRAQAQGQLVALSRMGATHVGVAVEWITAGDAKVCPKCEAMEGHIFAIEKAWGLIPKHPNCRCAFNPVEADEDSDY